MRVYTGGGAGKARRRLLPGEEKNMICPDTEEPRSHTEAEPGDGEGRHVLEPTAPVDVEARVVRRRRFGDWREGPADERTVFVHYERSGNGGCCCAVPFLGLLLLLIVFVRGCLSFV